MDIFYFPLDEYIDDPRLFFAFADDPMSLFFDSAARQHPASQYSYLLFDPVHIVDFQNTENPFDTMRGALKNAKLARPNTDYPPFQGGLAGITPYDGRALSIGIYNQGISIDHSKKHAWYFCHACDKAAAQKCFGQVQRKIDSAAIYQFDSHDLLWQEDCTRAQYMNKIKRVQDYILAGDIFQANLAQHFSAKLPENFNMPAHYWNLRHVNAAPFSVYMNAPDYTLCSSSPERFISCSPSGEILTQPIKGTAPRYKLDPARDEASRQALSQSAKDRAENIMITDLLRNDLSKSCLDESIEVPKICEIEQFENVYHLVSSINGMLCPDKDVFDLLRGAFPGGSITGAPKLRAIDIIEELEETARGSYCGSTIMIGPDGYMDSNILIRSLVFKGDSVSLYAGGGITLLSDPGTEYQELRDKASALFESFHTDKEESL